MKISTVLRACSGRNGLKRAIIPLAALVTTPLVLLLTIYYSPWLALNLRPYLHARYTSYPLAGIEAA